MNSTVRKIDDNFAYQKESVVYPFLYIENATDLLQIVLTCIKPGDLHVCINFQGNDFMLGEKISKSPIELSKLLKLYKFKLYLSENRVVSINKVSDLLELGVW